VWHADMDVDTAIDIVVAIDVDVANDSPCLNGPV
jgi:hypothetical protein